MTTDELRIKFKAKYPDINVIRQSDIHKLLYILDEELDKHTEAGNLVMNMIPLNNFVAKMLRTKGLKHKGLELKVRAHYFEYGREAITFTRDGSVYFCGWAGGTNHLPFLRAFERWLE